MQSIVTLKDDDGNADIFRHIKLQNKKNQIELQFKPSITVDGRKKYKTKATRYIKNIVVFLIMLFSAKQSISSFMISFKPKSSTTIDTVIERIKKSLQISKTPPKLPQAWRHETLLKRDSNTQVFFCEYCETLKNAYFQKHLRTTASVEKH